MTRQTDDQDVFSRPASELEDEMDRCLKQLVFVHGRGSGLILAVAAIIAAVGLAAGRATASPAAGPKVVSSLNGQSVLPSRLHWTATVSPKYVIVSAVNFLIDGKLVWDEAHRVTPPFVFGGDYYNGTNRGWLITAWLTPGEHQFTVQAVTSEGTIDDTTSARVTAAPEPPAALAGTWTRIVTTADTQKAQAQYGGAPPVGRWHLIFNQIGSWELDPKGSGVVNQYTASGHTLTVYAPIWMAPEGITRYGHHGIGGNDRTAAGPFGTYTWSVTGDQLALTAENEGCPDRGAILEVTWTRTAPLG
jgi:hypothetical protein